MILTVSHLGSSKELREDMDNMDTLESLVLHTRTRRTFHATCRDGT